MSPALARDLATKQSYANDTDDYHGYELSVKSETLTSAKSLQGFILERNAVTKTQLGRSCMLTNKKP